MTASPEPKRAPTPDTARPTFNHQVAKLFFGAGSLLALSNALAYGLLPSDMGSQARAALVAACLCLAVVYAVTAWGLHRATLGTMVLRVAWCTASTTVLSAVLTGQGVHTPSLGYLGLLVCIVSVLSSVPSGVGLALTSGLAIVALGVAHARGWLPTEASVLHVTTQALVIAAAVVAGTLISRLVSRALRDAEEREHRFRGLLTIAADVYWELDSQLRLVAKPDDLAPRFSVPRRDQSGEHPWDLDLGISDADRLATRVAMEAHEPFSDLRVQRIDRAGRSRQFLMSGRPRFTTGGEFLGYWGVGKEITGEVMAQQAVHASENRYQELFSRSPTPLLLHRDGLVVDANEAAAAMFGQPSAQSLLGTHLLERYVEGPSRELQTRRLADLQERPMGSALDMVDFQLRAADGRLLTAQATDVLVNEADGRATLSIYYDITARVAAEKALRRSEVMLTHMFATSPDFITLSELDTSRYLMVNDSFSRIFGYAANEVVGQSALDLGIWYDPEARKPLVEAIATRGGIHELPVTFVTKGGQPVALLLSAARFELDGRQYMVVNGRDVTESQRVQHEHEAMLQNALIGIALTREGRFVQVNDRFERMFGWDPGALVGQNESVVWLHGEDPNGPEPAAPLEVERMLRRRDGTTFIGRVMGQPVTSPHPRLDGTIWIAEDITERRQIDQALADARDHAEAANRAKSAFLANTSHEIRTPLNGLLGLARLAMQTHLDEQRRQQYLAQIHDSAQSLAGIISDILDLSKIEAGKFSVDAAAFDLRALLNAVHHAYQSLALAHSLTLDLQVDDTLPAHVLGDPLRLRQILSNYITNGVKFTARGSVRIDVRAAEGDRVRFSVEDTGPGIDPTTQARLFQPFTQADQSTTRRFGGTGLGLSICKELATLMGGSVGVDSHVGHGSRFWAELPLPAALPAAVGMDDEARDIHLLSGCHVLLVEDNPVNMLIGVSTLEPWGVDVVQATDGHQAIEAVARAETAGRPFDVVLMDVHMPHLSGHEASRLLRQQYSAEALPIIALTAAALVSEREEAMAVGMNDFLTKPLDPQKLRHALVRVVVSQSRFGTL